jgi:hypothetical protein
LTTKRSKMIVEEVKYQYELFCRWLREQRLRLLRVDRKFYCQADIEGMRKCEKECKHCKEYYKPLNEVKHNQ